MLDNVKFSSKKKGKVVQIKYFRAPLNIPHLTLTDWGWEHSVCFYDSGDKDAHVKILPPTLKALQEQLMVSACPVPILLLLITACEFSFYHYFPAQPQKVYQSGCSSLPWPRCGLVTRFVQSDALLWEFKSRVGQLKDNVSDLSHWDALRKLFHGSRSSESGEGVRRGIPVLFFLFRHFLHRRTLTWYLGCSRADKFRVIAMILPQQGQGSSELYRYWRRKTSKLWGVMA